MAVVSNAATQILMRQAPQAIDAVTTAFGLTDGERGLLLAARRGEALLVAGSARVHFEVVSSAHEDYLARPWLAGVALAALIAWLVAQGLVAQGLAARWRHRRMTRGAVLVGIVVPPVVEPAGAAQFWATVYGASPRRPGRPSPGAWLRRGAGRSLPVRGEAFPLRTEHDAAGWCCWTPPRPPRRRSTRCSAPTRTWSPTTWCPSSRTPSPGTGAHGWTTSSGWRC